ncbi:hypothetical protein [Candidatus Nitrosotenuis cloacae]|uniref:hypothetical protein n=1 Tax=Candidatus Nitrosotenuis cloacae TaxID=1603555 RepID=UPI0022810C25|nr:hypothetical protein [Candidatus Nitrosotenuis cloacae]
MIYSEDGKSMGVKTISTKLSREEFTRLQYHCKTNDEAINSFLKRVALAEIDNPAPIKIAGKSRFEYNRQKDNFAWKVVLDDNSVVSIDNDLPTNTVEQLLKVLEDAVHKRRSIIKKTTMDSASIPNRLLRVKK